jgi:hypothetical protein
VPESQRDRPPRTVDPVAVVLPAVETRTTAVEDAKKKADSGISPFSLALVTFLCCMWVCRVGRANQERDRKRGRESAKRDVGEIADNRRN